VISLHELTINWKVSYQDAKNDDLKIGKDNVGNREFIQACMGLSEKPDKSLKLFLQIDCDEVDQEEDLVAPIHIINTGDPKTLVDTIGAVSLRSVPLFQTKKNGDVLQKVKTLAQVNIACEGAIAAFELDGVLDINFKENDFGDFCPTTVNGKKFVGELELLDEDVQDAIVDNTTVKAKKPTLSIGDL